MTDVLMKKGEGTQMHGENIIRRRRKKLELVTTSQGTLTMAGNSQKLGVRDEVDSLSEPPRS